MEKNLSFRIISTDKIEYSQNIDMVLLPGTDGEFGVLPHHMEMIATLKEGEVKIYRGKEIDKVNIKSGVVSIYADGKVDLMIT